MGSGVEGWGMHKSYKFTQEIHIKVILLYGPAIAWPNPIRVARVWPHDTKILLCQDDYRHRDAALEKR